MNLIKKIFIALLWLPFLTGCSNEDDIQEIFANKKWKVVYTAYTSNWDDPNDFVRQETYMDDIKDMNAYVVYFGTDVITITGKTAVWKGTWIANGKDRTIQINIQQKNNDGTTPSEKEFMNRVANARYYKGDANILKLFLADKQNYVQFRAIN